MLLSKQILGNPNNQTNLSFANYEKKLLFFDLFHNVHKEQLCKITCEDEIIKMADYAAAVAAKILSETLDQELIISALRCCRDVLLSRGFEETSKHDMANHIRQLPDEYEHVIFVAGCQNEFLLEARVETALRLIKTISKPVHVAFVGGAPPERDPRIPQEHRRMKEMFYNMLDGTYGDKDYSEVKEFVTASQIFEETYSKTTVQNIELFFQHEYFQTSNQRCLYLVSSTFHLLRLANDCLKYIEENNNKITQNIIELVLNGADHVNKPDEHVFEPIYLKLMLFDIYSFLFSKYGQNRTK